MPLFGSHLWISFDRQGWEEIRRTVKPPPGGDPVEPWSKRPGVAATYDCMVKGEQHIVVQLDVPANSSQDGLIGIIAHESFHVAMSVMAHVGISVYAHSDEPPAYVAQWVAQTIRDNLPEGVSL